MATLNQPFSLGSSKGMTGQITVTQVMDVQTNKSQVSIKLEFKNTSYYGHRYYLDGSISVDGSPIVNMSSSAGGHSVYIQKKDTFYEVGSSPYTTTVSHRADGSKTITIAVSIKGIENNGSASNGFSISKSTSVVLNTIPRASTIGATDANIGSVSMIAVNRKSTTYTHSIHFTFGEESGYIAADGSISAEEVKMDATSIAFTVPSSFYAQIPNKKSAACTLTCKTYSSSTQIGNNQTATFVVTAAEALSAPQVSGTVEDINPTTLALTGDASKFIRYYSEALCTIAATARDEASIKTKIIDGTVVEGNTHTISGISKDSVAFSATDSRGYTTSATIPVNLIPYIQLTCVASGKRKNPTDGTAEITVKGNYYNGSLGGTDNALTLQYRNGNGELQTAATVISGNTYTATIALEGLTYTESFTFTVTATDKVTSATQIVTIGKGIPVFDWGENDFRFHVPIQMDADIELNDNNLLKNGDPAFAPAGYGLGESVASRAALTDANSAVLSGWYYINSSTANGVGASATLVVDGYGSKYATQTANIASSGQRKIRHLINGTWGEWGYDVPSLDLLWQNASPTSEFASQEVAVDPRGYRFLLIRFLLTNDSTHYVTKLVRVASGQSDRVVSANYPNAGFWIGYRYINSQTTSNKVQIGNFLGAQRTSSTNWNSLSSANTYCIPTHIYGIK